jgi:hypothetical protein
VEVEEAECLLARFNRLANSLKREFVFLFVIIQIVIIFSTYNTVTGMRERLTDRVHYFSRTSCG